MPAWRDLVTIEVLCDRSKRVLDHLFAEDKSRLMLGARYTNGGDLLAHFHLPFGDGSLFLKMLGARKLGVRVVDPWPLENVQAPLADAMAVELVRALLFRMDVFWYEVVEYQTTFAPLVKLASRLCARGPTSPKAKAVHRARVLQEAVQFVGFTDATAEERQRLEARAAIACGAAGLHKMAGVAFLGVCLRRWSARCVERMYAPGGRGWESARRSFEAHAAGPSIRR